MSLLSLCVVALIGLILRSKMIFPLPFINYNHLLEAHGHFSFGGWATTILLALFVKDLLPESVGKKKSYQWLLGFVALLAWAMLISFSIGGYNAVSTIFSLSFVVIIFLFGSILIKDILKANLNFSISLLAVSSIICLILSSAGVLIIANIFFTRSFDATVYRNALFTYLHFQYNGFFTLAIFTLLFNYIIKNISLKSEKRIRRFSIAICLSVLPSLFLSYLWQDPDIWYRIVAVSGSLLLLFCLYLFLLLAISLQSIYRAEQPVIRCLLTISFGSFMLKAFLQSFTIIPVIGNAIFGSRPVIMGFLHLVFLSFVTLFIVTYLTKTNLLNTKFSYTKVALIVFTLAVILNELLLFIQGLTTMFTAGGNLFLWLLWIAGILLFVGTVLLAISRIQSKKQP